MNFYRNFKQALALDQDFVSFDPSFQPKIVSKLGCDQTCVAFDSVQGYFVIGLQNGSVVLVNILEYELDNPQNQISGSAILTLLVHHDYVVATNAAGQLIVWNLSSKSSFCHSFTDVIVKIDSNPESSWLFISFQSGITKLMDCLSGKFSDYYIAVGVSDSDLKDMSLNPNDMNQIMLGFESECVIWDFAQKRPVERFILQKDLNRCAWKPDGNYMVTGYRNGLVAVWKTKKGFFGKVKETPLFTKKYENAIMVLKWVQLDGDLSFIFVGFENSASITCLEIHGDRFEKALESNFSIDFDYASFLVVISHTARILLAYNNELPNLYICTLQSKYPVELPACLRNSYYGFHSTSCISDDGFLFSSAVKNGKPKSVSISFGGTTMAKNSIRNYHVQVILRKEYLEFWQMSIPFPLFLSRAKLLPSTPHIVEIFADLKQNSLILMAEKSVIICDLIKQSLLENVDEMLEKLDDTIEALNEDRKEILKLHEGKKIPNLEVEGKTCKKSMSKSMESIKSTIQSSSESIPKSISNDSFPKDKCVADSTSGNPVFSMVKSLYKKGDRAETDKKKEEDIYSKNPHNIDQNDDQIQITATQPHSELAQISSSQNIRIIHTPPMYIADSNWTVLFQIDLVSPIVSCFWCASQRVYAVCSSNFLSIVHQDRSILYEEKITDNTYLKDRPQLAVNLAMTKIGVYRISDRWCVIATSTQSIFLFEINKRVINPFSAFHGEKEFGSVLEIAVLGHDYSQNPTEDEKHLVIFTNRSILILDVDEKHIFQSGRRDFGFLVCKATVSRIQVSADAIVVLALPQLNVIYQYSLANIAVAKSHLSEAYISSSNGLVGLWLQQNKWIFISLNTSTNLPEYDLKVFDNQKMKKHSDQVRKRVVKQSEVADSLFASKKSSTNDPGNGSLANGIAKIGNALEERGEKLNELQEKTGQIADASHTFAERARELARLEKEKRWYQI